MRYAVFMRPHAVCGVYAVCGICAVFSGAVLFSKSCGMRFHAVQKPHFEMRFAVRRVSPGTGGIAINCPPLKIGKLSSAVGNDFSVFWALNSAILLLSKVLPSVTG